MILAPLRGVTIRPFRETFADVIASAGFTEAVTPFIPALAGVDPLRNDELKGGVPASPFALTPQFIGKDPAALRSCLARVRDAGFATADLNAGCPYPMVRNKGRGSGLLKTPDLLCRMLEAGCETMGAGRFSLKARLGVDRNDELLKLMPRLNDFPLRHLTVHARNARQMYGGVCDLARLAEIRSVAKMPVVANGDIPFPPTGAEADSPEAPVMIGRGFVRSLGARDDADELLRRYVAASRRELFGDRPVLGRMKELLSYWKDQANWRERWSVLKICRSVGELLSAL